LNMPSRLLQPTLYLTLQNAQWTWPVKKKKQHGNNSIHTNRTRLPLDSRPTDCWESYYKQGEAKGREVWRQLSKTAVKWSEVRWNGVVGNLNGVKPNETVVKWSEVKWNGVKWSGRKFKWG
jgi:hypothetical protein